MQTSRDAIPVLPFLGLETLWIQVAGTLCNIACRHCFISCGPKNETHRLLSREQVRALAEEGVGRGAREFYLTGGEPFLHEELLEILEDLLQLGPVSVLTNGMLLDQKKARRLRELADGSRYSLDLRVSLDGTTEAANDAIRGRGTWRAILEGLRLLADVGIDPVLTVTEVTGEADASRDAFRALLRDLGLPRPRLKFLAPFRIGREAHRTGGYADDERLHPDDLTTDAASILQCGSARMVTSEGVWPCPILINDPDARLGDTLDEADGAIRLASPACLTCWVEGVTCRT